MAETSSLEITTVSIPTDGIAELVCNPNVNPPTATPMKPLMSLQCPLINLTIIPLPCLTFESWSHRPLGPRLIFLYVCRPNYPQPPTWSRLGGCRGIN